MAAHSTSGVISELQQLTECSICLNTFTDPKALPCMHSLCRGCLQGMIDTATSRRNKHINCPLCQKHTPIPQTPSADEFPNAFFFNNLCDILQNKQSSKSQDCQSCLDDNETVEAQWICIDCADILCNQCKKYHTKILKSQICLQLSTISVKEVNQILKNRTTDVCTVHGKELEYLCKDCNILLCVACQFTDKEHKQHTTEFIKDKKVQQVHRNNLEEFTTKCERHLQLYKASMDEIKVKENTNDKEIDDCVQKIEDRSQEMCKIINQHRDELTQQAETVREQYHTGARLQYDKLTREHDDLERVLKEVATVKDEGADIDVVRFSTQNTRELETKVSCTPQNHIANPVLELNFDQNVMDLKGIYGDMMVNVAHLSDNIGQFELGYDCTGLAIIVSDQISAVQFDTNNGNVYGQSGKVLSNLDTDSPLKKAWDVTTDKDNIYVSDCRSGNVYVYDKSNKYVKEIKANVNFGTGIAIQGDLLYITSCKDNCVYKVSLNDHKRSQFIKHEDMKFPRHIAVTPEVVVVTCANENLGGSNNIVAFGNKAKHLFTYSGNDDGRGNAKLNSPRGVIIYKNQYVVAADFNNSRLVVLSVGGMFCGHICMEGNPQTLPLDNNDNICNAKTIHL